MRILVTGGAGFIGSAVARALRAAGHGVTLLDLLDPQVHGRGRPVPPVPGTRLRKGDVRDREVMKSCVRGADAVVHLAAAVGVGQSQYEIRRYADVNVGGTACLLDVLANERHSVKHVVIAGSNTSYGEGAARCRRCGRVRPLLRMAASVTRSRWEPACPGCGGRASSVPTREDDATAPTSIYAVTKSAQEALAATFGSLYRTPVTALRFFNVYGPGQSLSNPYTGVASIFLCRLKNGKPPVVYEDGLQTRDFIHVEDVARAVLASLRCPRPGPRVLNVGTGTATTILELAHRLARLCGVAVRPSVTRRFRAGDVRHCTADVSAAREELGFDARTGLDEGLRGLVEWARSSEARDGFERAERELRRRGLL